MKERQKETKMRTGYKRGDKERVEGGTVGNLTELLMSYEQSGCGSGGRADRLLTASLISALLPMVGGALE